MSDITINSNEGQDEKRKTTPIEESSMVVESQKLGLPVTVLQIWQGHEESNFDLGFWRPTY